MNRMFRRGLVVVLAVSVVPTAFVVSNAIAQPRKPGAAAKPAPKPTPTPAAKPDAAPEETTTTTPAEKPNAATTASDAQTPSPASEASDGGLRSSPLNPQPQELPSNAVDGGVPVDYDRLLADIAALRARVAAVSDNLYQSRVAIALQLDNDKARVGKLTVSLDDGVVYTAPPTFAASDMTPVYDHAVAPGRHAVTVEIERRDARDEAFRTTQRSRFTIDVPRDNKVDVQVKLTDDSGMGADFPSDKSGKYDLRFRVKAVAKPVGK
jgi:hypothetical protein